MLIAHKIVTIALTTCSLIFLGCKGQGAHTYASSEFPVPVIVGGAGDATAPRLVGTIKTGDGQQLAMDLQRPPAAGTANLFACWDVPPEPLLVGRAVCADDASKTIEIKAANLEYLCRTSPEFGTLAARAHVDFSGCSSYKVFAYQFEPMIAVELISSK